MNQDNTKLPGIPFDASNPQDLARLKAGWPLVQRDGKKFDGKFLAVNEKATESNMLLFVESDGDVYFRSMKGEFSVHKKTHHDLFFASNKTRKSKWVAVVRDDNSKEYIATQDTKEGLEQLIARLGDTILSGPVELSWEEDAPLPPVEQPKTGWYVGPFASRVNSLSAAEICGGKVTYGTLTEVQP